MPKYHQLPLLEPQYSRKDFASEQDVRWCPGCGDYSILSQVQKVLADLGRPREKTVFISGIGCSGRFPYYMGTYGMHTIHGRAPTIATGLKIARPDLDVWVITGDGDALSIGGNHLMHALRRNPNINILLFNNRIYGLTKGQVSPTSPLGHLSKSSPYGSLMPPLNPCRTALASGATFVARTIDVHTKHLQKTLIQAAKHQGTSFVEIYQNCNIFNDGTWGDLREAKLRADHLVELEQGQPLIYGKQADKVLTFSNDRWSSLSYNEDKKQQLPLHPQNEEEFSQRPFYSYNLLHLEQQPDLPTPIGILYQEKRPCFEESLTERVQSKMDQPRHRNLKDLYQDSYCWKVGESPEEPSDQQRWQAHQEQFEEPTWIKSIQELLQLKEEQFPAFCQKGEEILEFNLLSLASWIALKNKQETPPTLEELDHRPALQGDWSQGPDFLLRRMALLRHNGCLLLDPNNRWVFWRPQPSEVSSDVQLRQSR